MTVQDLIAALELPASCRVDQRIPKKLLVENGAPTAADKRNLTEGIEEIKWVATLKASTIAVPEYRDEAREYLEVAVLHIALRQDAKVNRIAELTHRAVPYPLVLLLTKGDTLTLSMAHIRWAQNEAGKVVLDGEALSANLNEAAQAPEIMTAFLKALSITRQPRDNLRVLYQGWLDTLTAFQAAQITGAFVLSQTNVQAAARRASLLACREIEQKIATLRAAAAKEKQVARQVALNLEIKQLQAKQQQASALL
ncbi:MAG: DUF4391 domain-containing protein [Nitrosomonas sp.]|nr:DUF4391 domain-containing protein [Nitrosomonas sp.]TXH54778.1 MAG: DUF4391 domain-containing protein [Desulfurellales bacterium]